MVTTFEPSRLSPGLRFKGYTPRRFPKCPQVACFVVVSGAPEMSVGKLSGMRELREGCVRKEREAFRAVAGLLTVYAASKHGQ